MLRLVVGIGLSAAAAFGLAWPTSFLTPMLAASFLISPGPRPKLVTLVSFPVMILCTFMLAIGISTFALNSPPLALLAVMLMVYRCFYLLAHGIKRALTTWALIGILLIPVMACQSMGLAVDLTMGIFGSGVAAMGFVWVAHVLVPDPDVVEVAAPASPPAPPSLDHSTSARQALIRTLVILPLEAYVLLGQSTDDIKLLIFSAMLAQSPNLQAGAKGGKAMIVGNVFGGIVAMLFYELLVMCTSYIFLVLLFVLLSLVFGRQIFGEGKWAGLCKSGFGTAILLVGMGTMPIGDDIDTQFYARILLVVAAAIYIVLAFRVVDFVTSWRAMRRQKVGPIGRP